MCVDRVDGRALLLLSVWLFIGLRIWLINGSRFYLVDGEETITSARLGFRMPFKFDAENNCFENLLKCKTLWPYLTQKFAHGPCWCNI